jgi:Mg2+ and Co2+ transporter CorA
LHDFRCLLTTWNARCATYEHAYSYEVARNHNIVEAYRLLTDKYERVIDDLAVHASKCRSLQKELDAMHTEALAQDAVIEGYARRLATQPVVCHSTRATRQSSIQRIAELEEQLGSVKAALVSAGDMLASSAPKSG